MERLQKYLAHAGIGSRRKCEELIQNGLVKVNGNIVNTLGIKIDPTKDTIKVRDKVVLQKEDKVYILLNKPEGYVTTVKDTHGRLTVIDLIKDVNARLYPVGRLDYDTEGLLLLTNDGQLAYGLTHPKHKVLKVYEALVKGIPDHIDLEKLEKGIILEDGITAPANIKVLEVYEPNSLIEISIHEGRNRQVRRMFEAINHPVLKLKRTQMGPLSLNNIAKGKYRNLSKAEIENLKKIT